MERKGRNSSEWKGRGQEGKGRAKEGREGGCHIREEPGRQRKGSKRPRTQGKGQIFPFLSILAHPFPYSLSPSLSSFLSLATPFLVPLLLLSSPSFFTWPLPSSPGPFLLYLEVRGQVKKEGDEGKGKGERKDSRDLRGKGRAMGGRERPGKEKRRGKGAGSKGRDEPEWKRRGHSGPSLESLASCFPSFASLALPLYGVLLPFLLWLFLFLHGPSLSTENYFFPSFPCKSVQIWLWSLFLIYKQHLENKDTLNLYI